MLHAIAGCGVAGITAAQAIKRADPGADVHVFGSEPYPYYRRPRLWEFIAGQIDQDEVFFRPSSWYGERGIALHLGTTVSGFDPHASRITIADGSSVRYDRLLLTTGARSFLPPVAGMDTPGVFSLRTLGDALAIKAYAAHAQEGVVIGGGLLGLETARALSLAGLDVTVVEFFPYLLPRQLDAPGAEVLQALLEGQGLRVITDARTQSVLGNGRVGGIRLESGRVVSADLVLCSTGIRCEVALARSGQLEVNRGVVVDDHLRTRSADGRPMEHVFAAGDVAEFRGRVYGIIPPSIDQARVAAANMVSPGSATYGGSLPATTLKVAGAELTSLGECLPDGDSRTSLRYADLSGGRYRKLVLQDGRIVGAILLNDPERVRPTAQLMEQRVDVSAHIKRLLDDDFDLGSLVADR
jgi:nitrite reductase (NADH) large subunit